MSSDEVSMYLTIENMIDHGTLAIPGENIPNSTVVDGKSYSWYEAGNIIAGIPLYVVGKFASTILPLSDTLKYFVPRAAVSLTDAFIGAWIAVLFFSIVRKFEVHQRLAIGMTLALTFCTFMLPYYKMFMREPILALCLLGIFRYLFLELQNENNKRAYLIAGFFAGFGILTKSAFAINLIPILLYLFLNEKKNFSERLRIISIFMMPVLLMGFGGTMLYNYLRFGNPLNSGYAGGTSFSTPIFVGLYGLLLSPGKGIIWFTPMLFLLIPAYKLFFRQFRHEALFILGLFVLNLIMSSMYVAWGGDGSWGPRYLAPFLPLFFIPITLYIAQANLSIKRIASSLAIIGFIIQIGGISIYAGAYLREIGEFPYKREISDPEFLYKAHFIPNYSPIIGHWKMLSRNMFEHLNGNYPSLSVGSQTADNRLLVSENDKSKLVHTLDFWFTYAIYSNISKKIIFGLSFLLVGLCGIFCFLLNRNTPKISGRTQS